MIIVNFQFIGDNNEDHQLFTSLYLYSALCGYDISDIGFRSGPLVSCVYDFNSLFCRVHCVHIYVKNKVYLILIAI